MSATLINPLTPLTAADRCDRCGAQAKVRAVLAAGDLLFCGHHSTQFQAGLAATGLVFTPKAA